MNVLLVNAGSSSLKLSLRDAHTSKQIGSVALDLSDPEVECRIQCTDVKSTEIVQLKDPSLAFSVALSELIRKLEQHLSSNINIDAVGHRVVHGADISASTIVNQELLVKLDKLSAIAPLHNPPSVAAIRAAQLVLPKLPHVAIFDTAFHRSMLPEASHYAIPHTWSEEWKIKRYGFHGLSHAYCARRAAELLEKPLENLRLIVCHLGGGCSAAAIKDGKSLDTTMGSTPLDGLMMATRCGSIDPGIVLFAQSHHDLTPDEIMRVLSKESGLLGVSGISGDMRVVLDARNRGDKKAALAVAMYCYRIKQAIASMCVPLGSVDALVFTAGVGENSDIIREEICGDIQFLGFKLDNQKNKEAKPDCDITADNSRCRIFVVATQEDITMLREVKEILRYN